MCACGCLPKTDSNRDDTYLSNVSLLFELWALVEIAFSHLELTKQERLPCFWPSIHRIICPSIYSSIYPPLPIYPFTYCPSHHLITYPLVHNLSTHVPTHSIIHTARIYLCNYSSHSSIHSFTYPSKLSIYLLSSMFSYLLPFIFFTSIFLNGRPIIKP